MLRQTAFDNELLCDIVNTKIEPREGIVGNLCEVNADALVDTLEVGRGVEAGTHAGGGQNRG